MSGFSLVFARRDRGTGPDRAAAAPEHPAAAGASWSDGRFELVDPEGGPRATPTGAIVFRGRLDNRAELMAALPVDLDKASDAELVEHAWRKWGERCPEHLLGDFAFAVCDAQSGQMFCARDHLGARPLYYSLTPDRLRLATDIRALLAEPDVDRDLDEQKVAQYLTGAFTDCERTFYTGIRRLPPGHSLSVTREGEQFRRYWQLDPHTNTRCASDEEYADAFRSLLSEALRCRVDSRRPCAFLLSGGLDSSALVGLAHRNRASWGLQRIDTLSAVFPDSPSADERGYIAEVLARGEFGSEFVSASDTSPLADFADTIAHTREPFHAPNLYVFWALARLAQQRGIQVLVDGVDGDTTVSHGTEFLGELFGKGRVLRAVREGRALARNFGVPTRHLLWHFCVVPALRGWLARPRPLRPPSVVCPDFAARVDWGTGPRPRRTLRELHYRALTSPHLTHTLELYQSAGDAFGLETRHPYFDRRLVEFCYGLPEEQRLAGGLDRVIQRRAVHDVVPGRIARRIHKAHWGAQFKASLLGADASRVEELLREPGPIAGILDPNAISRLFERCRQGAATDGDGMELWLAVTLGLWLKDSGRSGAGQGERPW